MKPNRHRFIMLFLAQKHNTAVAEGNAVYVHPFGKKRAQSKPYACNEAKGRKVMKRPTRKFWETRVSCLGSGNREVEVQMVFGMPRCLTFGPPFVQICDAVSVFDFWSTLSANKYAPS